ncbi:MAG: hypothetical protein A3F14_00390 [Gammaproteobacteria bacterium RIFCSPHIGHO2_12_FULL_43_28]|nr:MAG: hypothetical protein A3F14_00390 [Gammaproteobacteria bacterium RIFCSPHIGHO2_12_FULL_43_28]
MQSRPQDNAPSLGTTALEFLKELAQQSAPNYDASSAAAGLFYLAALTSKLEGAEWTSLLLLAGGTGFTGLAANQYGLGNTYNKLSSCYSTMFGKITGPAPKQDEPQIDNTQIPKKTN